MMIMFALFALLSVLRFRRYQSTPFSPRWWAWILVAATNMGLAFWLEISPVFRYMESQ